ncbi:MAG: ATPase, T2SS/T4P/T4SS family [Faecousia sp.]
MIFYRKELLELLPPWLRATMQDTPAVEQAREIRLRMGQAPQVVLSGGEWYPSSRRIGQEDMQYVINNASRFSAYASVSMAHGYLTAEGGHRIGLCGTAIVREGRVSGFRDVTSLCIRVARDIPGVAQGLEKRIGTGSVLILGPPGSGKTTLLRDLIRRIADLRREQVCVVDERCELFPVTGPHLQFPPGIRTDVLSGLEKGVGIEMALRSMSPAWIAVDEITGLGDCDVMEKSSYTGVRFLATVHARDREDLWRRPVYRQLMAANLFDVAIRMERNQNYDVEELKNK